MSDGAIRVEMENVKGAVVVGRMIYVDLLAHRTHGDVSHAIAIDVAQRRHCAAKVAFLMKRIRSAADLVANLLAVLYGAIGTHEQDIYAPVAADISADRKIG